MMLCDDDSLLEQTVHDIRKIDASRRLSPELIF
jgi:hypothetical protein